MLDDVGGGWLKDLKWNVRGTLIRQLFREVRIELGDGCESWLPVILEGRELVRVRSVLSAISPRLTFVQTLVATTVFSVCLAMMGSCTHVDNVRDPELL